MYLYYLLFVIQILKTCNIYFRKHLLYTLDAHEYLFINTFLIACFVLILSFYKIFYHNYSIKKLFNKVQKLSILQICFLIIIAFITICSSLIFINVDKKHNTPLINRLLSKVLSTILLVMIGVFFFKEKYNLKQYIGIFLTIIGIYLTINKN
jgi:drug/metabolite transporter (DMT)-like permease